MDRKRNPGGGRKPSKPGYDANEVLSQQMEAAVALYSAKMGLDNTNDHPSLQTIADDISLNPIKVRKLLITADVYKSEIANRVQRVFNAHRDAGLSYTDAITATMKELNLSKASVNAYLPYEKGVYFPENVDSKNLSVGAERQRHYRAVTALKKNPSEETLWNCIVAFRGYEFKTMSGLPFTYQLKRGRGNGVTKGNGCTKGNGFTKGYGFTKELWIDRREGSKSLAWSSVMLEYHNIGTIGEVVDRPKALGDIRGVSYIYGMFYRFGLIDMPEKAKEKMKNAGPEKHSRHPSNGDPTSK